MPDRDMLESLKGLIAIESVAQPGGPEGEPFGPGPAAALKYMLDLCAQLGFRTKDCGGHVGWAEIGQGRELVGVLCHLDVVPAGPGWSYPPYAMTEVGDRIYGRGICDDKGPAMCCVYAMKDILDRGIELKRRIRIIFGLCEETGGWQDMAYYAAHEELPTFGFTPDADFPAIYGEKGILGVELSMPLKNSGLISAAGGTASNVVPSRCEASYLSPDGSSVTIQAQGKPAHASTPEDGRNAISALMEKLAAVPELDSPFVEFYQRHIGWDYNGAMIGCGLEDEKSGKLTLNAGLLEVRGEDLVLTLDIRCPVSYGPEDVLAPIGRAAEAWGMEAKQTEFSTPVYMDRDGPVICALLQVYREVTGDMEHQPTVIGGGTYARAMDNIVAFGPMLPGRELTEHMENEYALREDLALCRTIYRRALEKLAGEEL